MATKNYGLVGVGSSVELGKGGARIKSTGGVVEARNTGDSAYAILRGAHPVDENDLVTLRYLKTKGDVAVTGQINGGAPPAAGTPGRVFICTTTGGTYTVNYLYYDDGSAWVEVVPSNGQSMVVTVDLTGGAVEFLGDNAYLWDLETTSWVNIGPAVSSHSKQLQQRTVDIAYTDSGALNVGAAVSANGRVLSVYINVTQVFNGTVPTLIVGDAGDTDRFVLTTEVDLKTVGVYKLDMAHLYSVSTQVIATIAPDGSTTGAANVTLVYAEA